MAPDVHSELVELAQPNSSAGAYEPHVAIDPGDSSRIAIVATQPTAGLGLGRSIKCWYTSDAGVSWEGRRIVQPYLDGEGAADPLVGFGPDGSIVAVALVRDTAYITARFERDQSLNRFSGPTFDEHMAAREKPNSRIAPSEEGVCLVRSEDDGLSWSGCLIPNSRGADKPMMAVDNHQTSPHCGNIYVAWADLKQGCLALTRSCDSARSAETAISFGGRNGFPHVQLAVTSDGAVHMMWIYAFQVLAEPEVPEAATGIFYSRSVDGGRTFSQPVVAAEYGGPRRVPMFSLGAAPDGSLLVVWSEADSVEVKRGFQARQTLRFIHTRDGVDWSAPVPLVEVSEDAGQGLPAVASTADAWYVLAFDAGPISTVIRLYRSDHDAISFRADRDLAQLSFGLQDIYLHGSYQVRFAHDLVNVGDYVGLAAVGSRVAAALVMPTNDTWPAPLAAYGICLDV